MMKRSKKIPRKNIKNIIVKDDLIAHSLSHTPYQLFCELFDVQNSVFSLDRSLLLEVIEVDERYYFFEGFKEVVLLMNGNEIAIRRVSLSKTEIEQRAWFCLMSEFINLDPINPKIFEVIKRNMPTHIQQTLFNKSLTIQHILDIKGLKRHHYDYQTSLYLKETQISMPSFSELIDKARYVNNR